VRLAHPLKGKFFHLSFCLQAQLEDLFYKAVNPIHEASLWRQPISNSKKTPFS